VVLVSFSTVHIGLFQGAISFGFKYAPKVLSEKLILNLKKVHSAHTTHSAHAPYLFIGFICNNPTYIHISCLKGMVDPLPGQDYRRVRAYLRE
jgi:hypothetical protein